jgi:predicted helicase
MTLLQYIDNINQRYKLGNATEHTFRGDLQQLLESMVPTIRATNEPKRQSCGAPDYILTKKDIPVGFIEAKDIGDKDLDGAKKTGNKEQFDRYKASLNNLIFTDYLNFHLYRDGDFITKIAIAEITDKGIKSLPENFESFENLIKDFCSHIGQTIKSSKKLAEMMAGKARLLSDIIGKSLTSDEEKHEDSTLKDQMTAFKDILIHDITPQGFADVYAQTIAYGMFAARLHDPTLPTFSRQEAAELIPKSNPFLRKLFGYIAGPDIDDRIKWIVDSLVEIFLACNVEEILKNYGKNTKMEDPIIHFYETFLSEYDPKMRKARGVWYTPQPVVNFIVRAVDDILKTEFDMPQGLADTSKTKIKVNQQGKQVEKEVHKVQILDPATGTGTFLAEVVKHIHKKFKGQQGIWSDYVETHLLPRLNGFELLMASYAMAHLKLDLLLTETGYKPTTNQRFRVYLTNSLEESHPDTGTLFANWLSTEANEANHIKRDTPVMCIIGNPPYSGESANKGEWIMKLMEDYKKEPGGKEKLKERNPKWINDDYVKFLRYGQHFIEKNGSGVLAFINPHGFLDNPTFRGMRWNLLKTYDTIYTIDLHGNSTKKETCPDGSPDVNVFDIMQGVAISIFVKTGKKRINELGKIFHYDLFGKRDLKYNFLSNNSIKTIDFVELENISPNYGFIQKNFKAQKSYNEGFQLTELFILNNVGIVTAKDSILVNELKEELTQNVETYYKIEADFNKIEKISYRPFDNRFVYFDVKIIERAREKLMKHFLVGKNIGLVFRRQQPEALDFYIFCSNKIIADGYIRSDNKGGESVAPLYIYPETNAQQTIDQTSERTPNLNAEIVKQIAKNIGLEFNANPVSPFESGNMGTTKSELGANNHPPQSSLEGGSQFFTPIDILDYIYAVLHSPSYREKYKEFLKIDFPRVPYPTDQATFWQLVKLGGEIRQIHLLESPIVENYITEYPINGDNVVGKTRFELSSLEGGLKEGDNNFPNQTEGEKKGEKLGRVYINENQYFDNVPQIAWEFYIGGYQPAQKWLKDRKERKLEFEDILHYQKIIVALSETDRLMKEIDKIGIE